MSTLNKRSIRCAIYTRKSSEEGLEQSFSSLDAQREACQAYVLSQRQEGWRAIDAYYDDGGYSGGSMERPGLKRLLVDIEARKVDTVVVYKVDRLTRSLADFAKMVEAFDARGVSFVSVTVEIQLDRARLRAQLLGSRNVEVHTQDTTSDLNAIRREMFWWKIYARLARNRAHFKHLSY